MTDEQNEHLTNAINQLTQKLSNVLLQEYLALPSDAQLSLVLIKTGQLLLANILCHIAMDKDELRKVAAQQGEELEELTMNCAFTGFSDKFGLNTH